MEKSATDVVVVCSSDDQKPSASAPPEKRKHLLDSIPLAEEWHFIPEDPLSSVGIPLTLDEIEKRGGKRLQTLVRSIHETPPLFHTNSQLSYAEHNTCQLVFQFLTGTEPFEAIRKIPDRVPLEMPRSAVPRDFEKYDYIYTFKPDGQRRLLVWAGQQLRSCDERFGLHTIQLDEYYRKKLEILRGVTILDGEYVDVNPGGKDPSSSAGGGDGDDDDDDDDDDTFRLKFYVPSDIISFNGASCIQMKSVDRIKLCLQVVHSLNANRPLLPGLNILAKDFFRPSEFKQFRDRIKTRHQDGFSGLYFEHRQTRMKFETDFMIAVRPEMPYHCNNNPAERGLIKAKHPYTADLVVVDVFQKVFNPQREKVQNGLWSSKKSDMLSLSSPGDAGGAFQVRTYVNLACAIPSNMRSPPKPHGSVEACYPFCDVKLSLKQGRQLQDVLKIDAEQLEMKSWPASRCLDAVSFMEVLGVCVCTFSARSGVWKISQFAAFQKSATAVPEQVESSRRGLRVTPCQDVFRRIMACPKEGTITADLALVSYDVGKRTARLGYRGLDPALVRGLHSQKVVSGLRKVETLSQAKAKQVRFSDEKSQTQEYEPLIGNKNLLSVGVGELQSGDLVLASELNYFMKTSTDAVFTCAFEPERGIWSIMNVRQDRTHPNFHPTVIDCLQSTISGLDIKRVESAIEKRARDKQEQPEESPSPALKRTSKKARKR